MTSWKPWDETPTQQIILSNPPCSKCVNWRPERHFSKTSETTFEPLGVVLCHAKERYADFSCFESKDKMDIVHNYFSKFSKKKIGNAPIFQYTKVKSIHVNEDGKIQLKSADGFVSLKLAKDNKVIIQPSITDTKCLLVQIEEGHPS